MNMYIIVEILCLSSMFGHQTIVPLSFLFSSTKQNVIYGKYTNKNIYEWKDVLLNFSTPQKCSHTETHTIILYFISFIYYSTNSSYVIKE